MLFSYISHLITIFATRFQSYLMAIFTVIIPGIEIISANPLPISLRASSLGGGGREPIENGVTGRQLIFVQKSGTDYIRPRDKGRGLSKAIL